MLMQNFGGTNKQYYGIFDSDLKQMNRESPFYEINCLLKQQTTLSINFPASKTHAGREQNMRKAFK